MNKKGSKILLADLRSTVPVYTAYLCDAFNRVGANCTIAGIRRDRELALLDHLDLSFSPSWDFSSRLPSSLQKAGALVEYRLNIRWLLKHAHRYDIVHLQWLPMMKYGDTDIRWIRKLLQRHPAVFYTVHNTLPHDLQDLAAIKRFARLYRMLPRLVVHTPVTRQRLMDEFEVEDEKISIVPHGPLYADFAHYTPPGKPPLLGMIGTIRPYKGIEDALELVERLKKRGMDFRFLLAGGGEVSYLRKLQNIIRDRGLDDHVKCIFRYLPPMEMISLYQQCSLVLAPYRDIDQSGAAITALSLGTPVVGYKVGGLDMLIRDGYNGKLVKYGDIEALAKAVHSLLLQPRKELFDQSRTIEDSFAWEKSARKLIALYQR